MSLRDDLKAYLDGELPAERMAEMREAIDRDPRLAQEAAELERITTTLRAVASQPSAVGLEATLRALDRAQARERRPWWPWLVPVAGMTAALVFVVAPTMQQAKTAAKRDVSVAYRKEASASMAAPEFQNGVLDARAKAGVGAGAKATTATPGEAREQKQEEGMSLRVKVPKTQPTATPEAMKDRHSDFRRRSTNEAGPQMTNVRSGDLKGQEKPSTGNISDARNFPTEPVGTDPDKFKAPVFDMRANAIKPEVETVVVEVESADEADEAVRQLVDRLGATVPIAYAAPAKSEADSAVMRSRNLTTPDRRLVLEVDEDRLAETKKRVTDTVKESQRAQRDAMSQNRSGAFRGAGGGFGGASQSSETQQGVPPGQSGAGGRGGSAQQTTGQSVQQGFAQAKSPQVATVPAGAAGRQKAEPENNLTKGKPAKPRKRIEVIVRITPKSPGKLEE